MARARVNGIEMAYDDAGTGFPVVLLHGYPFNRSLWSEQMVALQDGYRVITPDLRGLGETAPASGPATMEQMADDVAALMDELRVARAAIGGLSMGGYVALAFMRKFPARVRALVLADTRAQADTDEGRRSREEQANRILTEGIESIADGFLEKVLAPGTLSSRPEVVERVRAMILATPPRGAANALRGMAERYDQRDNLGTIDVPALVVVGSEDNLTPPADSELIHRRVTGSRFEVIEGAAHISNVERPTEFNRALRSFLDSINL